MTPLIRYTALAGVLCAVALVAAVVVQSSGMPLTAANAVLGAEAGAQPEGAFRRLHAQIRAWTDSFSQGYAVELLAQTSGAWPMEPDIVESLRARRPADALVRLEASCFQGGPRYQVEVLQTAPGLSAQAVHAAWVASRAGGPSDASLAEQVLRHHTVQEQGRQAHSVSITPRRVGAMPRLGGFQDTPDARPTILSAWPEAQVQCTGGPKSTLAQVTKASGLRISPKKAPTAGDLGLRKTMRPDSVVTASGWRVAFKRLELSEALAAYQALSLTLSPHANRVSGTHHAADDRTSRSSTWELVDGQLDIELASSPEGVVLSFGWTTGR